MRKILAGAASAVAFVAAAASAATFNLTSGGIIGTLTNDQGELINILAAGATESGNAFTLANGITPFGSNGIGLQRSGEGGSPNHAVDASGPDEAIIFQAQKASDGSLVAVNWESIVFGWRYRSSSRYDVWTSQSGYGDLALALDEQAISVGSTQLLGVTAVTIAIQADDWNWRGKDAFKIRSLSVEALPGVNQVPVPGALPLMLAGIAGMMALRRRKA